MGKFDLSKAVEYMASYTIQNKVVVEIGWIGEGKSGDYDENDSHDVPYLRFDAHDRAVPLDDPRCRSSQDASYCTRLPATLPKPVLESVCRAIAEAIADEPHWKRRLEELSWVNAEDAERIHKNYGDKK